MSNIAATFNEKQTMLARITLQQTPSNVTLLAAAYKYQAEIATLHNCNAVRKLDYGRSSKSLTDDIQRAHLPVDVTTIHDYIQHRKALAPKVPLLIRD